MYILILIQQLISSATHVVSKDITAILPEEQILFFRAGIACTIFALWIFFKGLYKQKFTRKEILTICLLGVLNIPANQYVFFKAVHLTTAPNVALAYALSPAFVLMISLFSGKEKPDFGRILGIAIAVVGSSVILFERGLDISSDYFLGNMLGLLASMSWAVYTVIGKQITLKFGAIFTTGATMITGYISFLPIFLLTPEAHHISNITTKAWAEIFYLGAITSVVGYAIWFIALKKIDATKVSVFNNLQPVLTTILAMIFLGTQITIPFILGGLLIIVGVVITQRK